MSIILHCKTGKIKNNQTKAKLGSGIGLHKIKSQQKNRTSFDMCVCEYAHVLFGVDHNNHHML